MAQTKIRPQVTIKKTQDKTYRTHSYFFGLISWKELIKTDTIGSDLVVNTLGNPIDKLFIDGVEIDISNWKLSAWKAK